MSLATLMLLLVLAAIAAFAAFNWAAFTAPTAVWLGPAVVEAPLGLIMLGLLVLLTVLFLGFVVYLQTSVLLDARRHARELQANRELADRAEASRFTELRAYLEAELRKQAELDAETRDAILARLDQLEHELRSAVEQSGNSVAAHIGELDDRLGRQDSTRLLRG